MNIEKLQKMAGSVRTGGKGSVRRHVPLPAAGPLAAPCVPCAPLRAVAHSGAVIRRNRKKKAVHKTTTTDDKRLQNTLKRLGVNTIPGIEEGNIFKDENVIHFANPKGAARRRQSGSPSPTRTLSHLTRRRSQCKPASRPTRTL